MTPALIRVVFVTVLLAEASGLADAGRWAFKAKFNKDPSSPSSNLPASMDYIVTQRTHPREHFTKTFDLYPADHDESCAGPDPSVTPLRQHMVRTLHLTSGSNPDKSFYICKNHMMSSMGDVEGYSVTAFHPKQDFDFANGGQIRWDVNIDYRDRSWFEVMIAPREQTKLGAAEWWFPIDEKYPRTRLVAQFFTQKRYLQVGDNELDPQGIIGKVVDDFNWPTTYPSDPANDDATVRRKMRLVISSDLKTVTWLIEKANGKFSSLELNVPGGIPFTRGIVLFKTHAYTPKKEGNFNKYTFHWDNIKFDGPVVGKYANYESPQVVYLQQDGDRMVGETETNYIWVKKLGANPVLSGQVHAPSMGEVLLSINNGPTRVVDPIDYERPCNSEGWTTFHIPLEASEVKKRNNSFKWTIGTRNCTEDNWNWIGFSIKSLELQFDK